MKDDRGLYYFPYPSNKRIKMYVRLGADDVEFRPWDDDDPNLWDEHGWAPFRAILAAAELAKKEGAGNGPPMEMYDVQVAIRLLKDHIQDS